MNEKIFAGKFFMEVKMKNSFSVSGMFSTEVKVEEFNVKIGKGGGGYARLKIGFAVNLRTFVPKFPVLFGVLLLLSFWW
jgi:hypothetical protein